MSFPPPDGMTQYVNSHGFPGNWFDPIDGQTADSLGVSAEGRKISKLTMFKGAGLRPYSKPILDKWTNPENTTFGSGGGVQLLVNDEIKNTVIYLNKIGI